MPESIPNEIARVLMHCARVATWVIPICLWLVHIIVLVPILNTQHGETKFMTAMQFFMLSGLLMIGCFVMSMIVLSKRISLSNIVPVLLNLSWVYYVKVINSGPTIGNL